MGWASSRTVLQGYMCTLQILDIEWKTLPMFDPYVGVYNRDQLHFSRGMQAEKGCYLTLLYFAIGFPITSHVSLPIPMPYNHQNLTKRP